MLNVKYNSLNVKYVNNRLSKKKTYDENNDTPLFLPYYDVYNNYLFIKHKQIINNKTM